MKNSLNQNDLSSSFSLRKIPVTQEIEKKEITENDKYLDKIKILELSNIIDAWEKELLFSEAGFYSLKGKEVKGKSKEFLSELEKFINSKITEMKFVSQSSIEAAKEMQKIKTENIKMQMFRHETKEIFEWEISVYNSAIESSTQKAVLYKNNPEVIKRCFQNALSVIKMMSEREKWTSKVLKSKKDRFISEFYYALIKSFLDDKDIRFVIYYEKSKELLDDDKVKEIESSIIEMRNNITAYNLSKELFSYNLDKEEIEREIRKLKDSNLENAVRKFIHILKKNKEKQEDEKIKYEIDNNWKEVLALLEKEPDKALLYLDVTKEKEIVKTQKEYIKKIIENGYVATEPKKYIELLEEMVEDLQLFKNKQLNSYRVVLSLDDYAFFEKMQKESGDKSIQSVLDYKFIFERLKKENIKSPEKMYEILMLFRQSLNLYKTINDKDADIEKVNKIIESVFERNIEKGKKGLDKHDSIVNNTSE